MREGPDHYTRLKPEPIDVIRAWDLPWCPANALKYIARYRNKGGVEDLKKARHYLDLEIKEMEKLPNYCPCGEPIGGVPCTPDRRGTSRKRVRIWRSALEVMWRRSRLRSWR